MFAFFANRKKINIVEGYLPVMSSQIVEEASILQNSFAQKIELSLIIAALVKLKLIQQSHISRIYFAYKGNQSRLLFTVSLPGG